jgi:hypothetical protein
LVGAAGFDRRAREGLAAEFLHYFPLKIAPRIRAGHTALRVDPSGLVPQGFGQPNPANSSVAGPALKDSIDVSPIKGTVTVSIGKTVTLEMSQGSGFGGGGAKATRINNPDPIEIKFTSDTNLPADTHWLQFVCRTPYIGTKVSPDLFLGGVYLPPGTTPGLKTKIEYFVKNGTWVVDSLDPKSPWYDTVGANKRDANSLAILDSPGNLGSKEVQDDAQVQNLTRLKDEFVDYLFIQGKVYCEVRWTSDWTYDGGKSPRWTRVYTGIQGVQLDGIPLSSISGYAKNNQGQAIGYSRQVWTFGFKQTSPGTFKLGKDWTPGPEVPPFSYNLPK